MSGWEDNMRGAFGTSGIRSTASTLAAGEDLPNDVTKVEQRASYVNISADTLIKTGPGRLWGFIVNSHTTGTLKLWDNTSAATTVLLNTISFAVGPNFVMFPVGVEFGIGLFADIGGTIDLTIFYK